jgi:peptidoglycan/LPS O-acetylase OafA/YrhL
MICFSAYTNVKKIFSPQAVDALGKKDPLDCLHGVRVMSMGWVCIGHMIIIGFFLRPIRNYDEVVNMFEGASLAIVYGGYFAVDTFFWITGVLTGLLMLGEIVERQAKIPWGVVYLHRFWRICPAYFLLMFFLW